MVKRRTLDLSDIDGLEKMVAGDCIHEILSLRNEVGNVAKKSANQALNDWHTVAPRGRGLSGLRTSVSIDNTYKYSAGLVFDNGKHAIQAHTLNKTGSGHGMSSRWAGYEDKFLSENGKKFLNSDINPK